MTRTTLRFASARVAPAWRCATAALVLSLFATQARAEIVGLEVYRDYSAGADADDENNIGPGDTYDLGPKTDQIISGGNADLVHKLRERGNGHAEANAYVAYLTSQNGITANGDFANITLATGQAAAIAGFDFTNRISFQTTEEIEYRVWGWIRTTHAIDGPELLACLRNSTVLAGDTRATSLGEGLYFFDVTSTIFPLETHSIECAAAADAAATSQNTQSSDVLKWRYELRFNGGGPACTDPNGDAKTTASDALLTLRAAVGQTTCDDSICDVSGDGNIGASDALATLKISVGVPYEWNCPISLI